MDDLKKEVLVDILQQENGRIRVELTEMIKTIHACLFSFIASLGIFSVIFMSVNSKGDTAYYGFEHTSGLITLFVSQIEFIIIIFTINVQADINVKSAYIGYLENKINYLVNEPLIFWESRICKDFWGNGPTGKNKNLSAAMLTQKVLYVFYFVAYLLSCSYSISRLWHWNSIGMLSCVICFGEVIIAICLLIYLSTERRYAEKYIKAIQPLKNKQLDIEV